jgi:hypothetical protein
MSETARKIKITVSVMLISAVAAGFVFAATAPASVTARHSAIGIGWDAGIGWDGVSGDGTTTA